MNDFRELKVWKESMDLTVDLYRALDSFPKSEIYGLTNQIKRSAISISSNIPEGAGRNSNVEFNQFLGFASGSVSELSTQIEIANRIGYLQKEISESILGKLTYIQKMIYRLQKAVKENNKKA